MSTPGQSQQDKDNQSKDEISKVNPLRSDSVIYFFNGIQSSKTIYKYDNKGNEICYTTYNWRDGFWDLSGKTETSYDANGNKAST